MKNVLTCMLVMWVCASAQAQSYSQTTEGIKFNGFMDLLKWGYVDTVNSEKLTDAAIVAVLKDLDPHSVYIPKEELKEMNEPLVGNFEGVGIQFNILYDTILVTATIPGGPSEKIGLMAGDKIIKIEDKLVAGVGFKTTDVTKTLRGDKGTKVKVSVMRRGSKELIDFLIVRDKIPLFSVDASFMANPETGYIKVNRFSETTTDEFRMAVKKVKAQGAQNLILDLTGNGGGYMNRAIEMADEFLSAGKLIVYTQGRNNPRIDYNATSKGDFEKGKIVVLIDEGSASASEIVTGAIQDWDRGLVIGRRSYGKGLVQKTMNLSDGGAMRMTVARYYTPAGRNIQKPYEDGYDAYQKDLATRYEHGEFTVQDSIHLPDSLKFYTNKKRMVYGGGGIMPDIFIPLDTSMISKYYSSVFRKGVLNQFVLNYLDNNRKSLMSQYSDPRVYKTNFKVDEALMNKFIAFAEKEGVEKNTEGLKTSDVLLRTQIKALIARNLWDLEAFYYVINDLNDGYQKALEVINDNTFDKMKITSN